MVDKFDMEIDQGATYKLTITIADTNITGYTFLMHFRRGLYDDTPDLVASNANGHFTITNAASGILNLNIPASVTALLTDKYVYDILMDSGTEKIKIMSGNVNVSLAVTR